MKIRKRIDFFGRVQGVGFRYRAYYGARQVGATGWVRNNWNGSVTMEIQGTEAKIEETIALIERSPYIRIVDMKSKIIPIKFDEQDFDIKDVY